MDAPATGSSARPPEVGCPRAGAALLARPLFSVGPFRSAWSTSLRSGTGRYRRWSREEKCRHVQLYCIAVLTVGQTSRRRFFTPGKRFMPSFRGQKIPTLVVFIIHAAGLLQPVKTVNW